MELCKAEGALPIVFWQRLLTTDSCVSKLGLFPYYWERSLMTLPGPLQRVQRRRKKKYKKLKEKLRKTRPLTANRNYISGLACWWLLAVEPRSLLLYPRTLGCLLDANKKNISGSHKKVVFKRYVSIIFWSVQACFGRPVHVRHSSCRTSLIFHLSWSSLLLF